MYINVYHIYIRSTSHSLSLSLCVCLSVFPLQGSVRLCAVALLRALGLMLTMARRVLVHVGGGRRLRA